MNLPKKLIEVAMPIKEISAESVRDKSIRHGHISTLHLWWARRPLPVCRAVVFASLVPDPLDVNCPQSFKDAVEILLGKANNPGDPYNPYENIPYTADIDKMEDNLRNRLLMYIGKFSTTYSLNEKKGRQTDSKQLLSDESLIKWENKDNGTIMSIARQLIWVANNWNSKLSGKELISQFDRYYRAITEAEEELYNHIDRHILTDEIKKKEIRLSNAISEFQKRMPKVFDPFTGGGAIPLEVSRLGCESFGNDINPVAYVIQKGSLEFPQKYGKPICFSREEFEKSYGHDYLNAHIKMGQISFNNEDSIRVNNRLSFDIEFYANRLIENAKNDLNFLFPRVEDNNIPIAYYWVRVGNCANQACKAEIPLLKSFYLANTKSKQVHIEPIITEKRIDFKIKFGKTEREGWIDKNLKCPCCGSTTSINDLKQQSIQGKLNQRIIAVIEDSSEGKQYRLPTISEIKLLEIPDLVMNSQNCPTEEMPEIPDLVSGRGWGIKYWYQMFSSRQIIVLQTLILKLKDLIIKHRLNDSDYGKAVITYLAILIDRITAISTSFGRWDVSRENIQSPFSKQAIPMVYDYPEGNILGKATGSIYNHLEWIIRYIESESKNPFFTRLNNASSGEKAQFENKSLTAVITDPPYYDAIAYADLSDFFYVWLKRTLGDVYPLNFATPFTPKSEECTALKHHHNNNKDEAKKHFEKKLTQIFDSIEHQTSDIVSIMFAHQSTEAWTTLCNAILRSRMNITGSWAIDTEMANRSLGLAGAVLASSVTVSARPSQGQGYCDYRTVKSAVEKTVLLQVNELIKLGFRGEDLLTACFGQAVSVFGKYDRVEKADGSEVSVAELLEMAKESAFNALLKGFDGDDFTKFYIGWLQLYGFSESDFDDAAKFSRVGLTINVSDLFTHNLFIKKGNKQELAGYKERIKVNHRIGETSQSFIIDFVHKAMALYSGTNRNELLAYFAKVAISPESSFWRVITSLCEVLPQGSDDLKQATGLLLDKDSLIRECKNIQQSTSTQGQLF